MSLDRARLVGVFRAAVAACDPGAAVRAHLEAPGRRRFGVAIGKAALAMARGAGPVERGVAIVPAGAPRADDVPAGWSVVASAHPFVDERSVRAASAARAVVDAAEPDDVVLALISGGASALVEEPIAGLTIAELGAITAAVMAAGATIEELNTVRSSLSRIKRGGLVARCAAPVLTLAVSDVVGDGLAIIGSGPTIGAWFVDDEAARRESARAILERLAIVAPPLRAGESHAVVRERDRAMVIAPMAGFGEAAVEALGPQAWLEYVREPLVVDVGDCASALVARIGPSAAGVHGTFVAWGEPTLRVPAEHGAGGRAQQLALVLARALRRTRMIAMVIGSDGVDGPPPPDRDAPAGAIVDGTTWDAIIAAGHDPERALARCDAGTALAAAGALVVTGPTGINHGDLVVIGDRDD